MSVHAFVDETRRGSTYYVVCAVVEPRHVTELRRFARGLLLPGLHELRFHKESTTRRRALADQIVRNGRFTTHIYFSDCGVGEERARQACLHVLVRDLLSRGAHRVVLDTRLHRDREDHQTFRRALGEHPSHSGLTFEHVYSRHEPLVWVADAVGWCYGAGGDWRRRVVSAVEALIEAP